MNIVSPHEVKKQLNVAEGQILSAFFELMNRKLANGLSCIKPGESGDVGIYEVPQVNGEEVKLSRHIADEAARQMRAIGWQLLRIDPSPAPHLTPIFIRGLVRPQRTELLDSLVKPRSPSEFAE